MIDLDALEALEKKATPGPWHWTSEGIDYGYVGPNSERTVLFGERYEGAVSADDNDAMCLVAARNALPELIRLARIGQRVERDAKRPDPFERGYAAALKAAAEVCAGICRESKSAHGRMFEQGHEWAAELCENRILSLPIVGEATNPGEQVPDSARIGGTEVVLLPVDPARPGPSQECVPVPREMLEEWMRWTSARQAIAGNSHHHDAMQKQMRAMLAAKEEHSQHLRNEGLRISAESVDAVDREEHDAHR